jgi:hypothetical protein
LHGAEKHNICFLKCKILKGDTFLPAQKHCAWVTFR